MNIVAVSGNVTAPSRTRALAREVLDVLERLQDCNTHLIEVADIGPKLAGVLHRAGLPAGVKAALSRIENADMLIAVSPVYRASYSGLFKHLFDFVEQDALVGVPVILGATGGSERHSLVIDHALRPLFSFFRAHTVPTALYATEADFDRTRLVNTAIHERICTCANEALNLAGAPKPTVRQMTNRSGNQIAVSLSPEIG
ncbi:FMN reductase [Noviherbaspirillum sp.]|jgi:FMN reductase|uniref:FMN reductase n=1 Tax=Noviherbaspirillum sp. TaxID=1926288 RepID=UPI0025F029FD|nr:FMN reductase [Noviherbaspirillum sp.]